RDKHRWGRLACRGCRRSRGGWPLRHRPRRSRARGPRVRGRPGLTMTSPALPSIWFERPVLPELVEVVEASCSVLGPGTDVDRYAGIETAVGVIAGAAPYDGSVMDRAPSLRVIARTGSGIAVCNTPDGPTISTAEHAITLMLMVAKKAKAAEASLTTGTSGGYYARHEGIELDGKVLGLVGCGRIARRVGAM